MSFVMAVDGGGSQTTAVVTDETGRLISCGNAAGTNHQTLGVAVACAHMMDAIETALRLAQLDAQDIAFVQHGLAGADRSRDFRIFERALGALPFCKWGLVSDAWQGL